jgi:galactokinase
MLVSRIHELLGADPLLLALLRETYGDGAQSRINRLQDLCGMFLTTYGDGPVSILSAPARINLLGEHVDYVSYIPTASLTFGSREHDMVLLFRSSDGGVVRGATTLQGCMPFSFDINSGPTRGSGLDTDQEWERALFSQPAPPAHWGNYIRGAVYFACFKHGERVRRGFDFLIDSSIPPAGGASSSSALTVLAAAAIHHANDIALDPLQLARDAARAEWYVGTRGGTMDHLTICLSRRSSLVNIAYSEEMPRLIPLSHEKFRLVTFFTHKADKSKEVMLEYNERAAVSRILIPAILDNELTSRAAPEEIELLPELLPQQIALAEVRERYPEAFRACERAFPALVKERCDVPLKIRDRARHHVGEVKRVAEAGREFEHLWRVSLIRGAETDVDGDYRRIGELLNQSHRSLCDLYEISTPEVEELIRIVFCDPEVYGARLMGGGFGGNVLVLTTANHVPALMDRVQASYYQPRGRNAVNESAVMVNTPGDGLSGLDPESAMRSAVESFNVTGRESDVRRAEIRRLLDRLEAVPAEGVWPVIVAAGRGERAKASGLDVPKPLVSVLGVPAILRILGALRNACQPARPPVVIVSPETEAPLRTALCSEDVSFILQPFARGTGDAVLCARTLIRDFAGRVLVVWATQPVLRTATVRRTLKLAALFPEYKMIVPTAMMERPYAPVERDALGRVTSAHETHLERICVSDYGESNVGMFLLQAEAMFRELELLHHELWHEVEMRYDRPRGELGFPNEMIRRLAGRVGGVFASPIADWREEKGIKTKTDVELCERYLREIDK